MPIGGMSTNCLNRLTPIEDMTSLESSRSQTLSWRALVERKVGGHHVRVGRL